MPPPKVLVTSYRRMEGRGAVIPQGVAKDDVEAVKWFRKAAEQNDVKGQFNLGAYYANGRGVAEDHIEAYKWMLLAAGQGLEQAKNIVTIWSGAMSPGQIADGKRRANDWLE